MGAFLSKAAGGAVSRQVAGNPAATPFVFAVCNLEPTVASRPARSLMDIKKSRRDDLIVP
jgi:hypothetical protein